MPNGFRTKGNGIYEEKIIERILRTAQVPDLDETRYPVLKAEVLEVLSHSYPNIEFMFNQEQKSGQGYYAGVRFQIYVRDQAGTECFLVEGGFQIGLSNC